MARGVGRAFPRIAARGVLVVVLALAALTAASASAGKSTARVTIFGDSAAEALDYATAAKLYLAEGLDVNWELKVCRRLVSTSCPYNGVRPPTVLDVVDASAKGGLGTIVVIDVGYNDYPDEYQGDMTQIIRALLDKGVQHVIWTTMHEVRDDYRKINATIRAVAASWPQVAIADWNAASAGQPWFNDDGIHLNYAGAVGLAKLLRPLILAACSDPCPPLAGRAPSPSLVIRVSGGSLAVGKLLAWKPTLRATYAASAAAFGPATDCHALPGKKSRATWSPLGIVAQFIGAPGTPCTDSSQMLLQTLTTSGKRWKTSTGLAVGDPVAKLKRLYPSATVHGSNYWLVKADRPSSHALFWATVRRGRVTAFSIALRAA
jgi:hypothetical protein